MGSLVHSEVAVENHLHATTLQGALGIGIIESTEILLLLALLCPGDRNCVVSDRPEIDNPCNVCSVGVGHLRAVAICVTPTWLPPSAFP